MLRELYDAEREFLAGAVLSGFLGPMFLATLLRLELAHGTRPGGALVLITGAARQWLELSLSPYDSTVELATMTAQQGEACSRVLVRLNCLVEPRHHPVIP